MRLAQRGRQSAFAASYTGAGLPAQNIACTIVRAAVTIVAGAGLLARSFANLQGQDPGFESRGRLTFNVMLPFSRYREPAKRQGWTEAVLTNLRRVPGVTTVGAASDFPLRDAVSSRLSVFAGC